MSSPAEDRVCKVLVVCVYVSITMTDSRLQLLIYRLLCRPPLVCLLPYSSCKRNGFSTPAFASAVTVCILNPSDFVPVSCMHASSCLSGAWMLPAVPVCQSVSHAEEDHTKGHAIDSLWLCVCWQTISLTSDRRFSLSRRMSFLLSQCETHV